MRREGGYGPEQLVFLRLLEDRVRRGSSVTSRDQVDGFSLPNIAIMCAPAAVSAACLLLLPRSARYVVPRCTCRNTPQSLHCAAKGTPSMLEPVSRLCSAVVRPSTASVWRDGCRSRGWAQFAACASWPWQSRKDLGARYKVRITEPQIHVRRQNATS
jgi:hypothetical protein